MTPSRSTRNKSDELQMMFIRVEPLGFWRINITLCYIKLYLYISLTITDNGLYYLLKIKYLFIWCLNTVDFVYYYHHHYLITVVAVEIVLLSLLVLLLLDIIQSIIHVFTFSNEINTYIFPHKTHTGDTG